MFALLMLQSQRLDPSRNESYNLFKMCMCVDFFQQRVDELLCIIHLSSLFSLDVDYIPPFFFLLTCLVGMWHTFFGYASFSLSFFLTCLLGMWHTFFGYASFISSFLFWFSQSTSSMVTLERKSHGMSWSFILWWMTMFAIFQCRSIACEWRCVRDLDHRNMKCISQRVATI